MFGQSSDQDGKAFEDEVWPYLRWLRGVQSGLQSHLDVSRLEIARLFISIYSDAKGESRLFPVTIKRNYQFTDSYGLDAPGV